MQHSLQSRQSASVRTSQHNASSPKQGRSSPQDQSSAASHNNQSQGPFAVPSTPPAQHARPPTAANPFDSPLAALQPSPCPRAHSAGRPQTVSVSHALIARDTFGDEQQQYRHVRLTTPQTQPRSHNGLPQEPASSSPHVRSATGGTDAGLDCRAIHAASCAQARAQPNMGAPAAACGRYRLRTADQAGDSGTSAGDAGIADFWPPDNLQLSRHGAATCCNARHDSSSGPVTADELQIGTAACAAPVLATGASDMHTLCMADHAAQCMLVATHDGPAGAHGPSDAADEVHEPSSTTQSTQHEALAVDAAIADLTACAARSCSSMQSEPVASQAAASSAAGTTSGRQSGRGHDKPATSHCSSNGAAPSNDGGIVATQGNPLASSTSCRIAVTVARHADCAAHFVSQPQSASPVVPKCAITANDSSLVPEAQVGWLATAERPPSTGTAASARYPIASADGNMLVEGILNQLADATGSLQHNSRGSNADIVMSHGHCHDLSTHKHERCDQLQVACAVHCSEHVVGHDHSESRFSAGNVSSEGMQLVEPYDSQPDLCTNTSSSSASAGADKAPMLRRLQRATSDSWLLAAGWNDRSSSQRITRSADGAITDPDTSVQRQRVPLGISLELPVTESSHALQRTLVSDNGPVFDGGTTTNIIYTAANTDSDSLKQCYHCSFDNNPRIEASCQVPHIRHGIHSGKHLKSCICIYKNIYIHTRCVYESTLLLLCFL